MPRIKCRYDISVLCSWDSKRRPREQHSCVACLLRDITDTMGNKGMWAKPGSIGHQPLTQDFMEMMVDRIETACQVFKEVQQ